MSVEKILQTRIINKNGTYAEWAASSIILKKGEIALVEFTTAREISDVSGNRTVQYVPTYLMKVGDGTKTFNELSWLSAPASDVYEWAKKESINDVDLSTHPTITPILAALDGLEGAMHFVGVTTTNPLEDGATVTNVETYKHGDVVIYQVAAETVTEIVDGVEVVRTTIPAHDIEFVNIDGNNTKDSWIELGDVTDEQRRLNNLESTFAAHEVNYNREVSRIDSLYSFLTNDGETLPDVLILDCGGVS